MPQHPQSDDRRFAWFPPLQPRTLGTLCGLLAAAGYTTANIGLRAVAHLDPVWVSAVKSAPTCVIMVPWLYWLWIRGARIFPDRRHTAILVVGALSGQFGGNVGFQWSLGVIGLALTSPLTTGSMILSGAILGRFVLMEPITIRSLGSMIVLIAATCVLSLGAREAGASIAVLPQLDAHSPDFWAQIAGGVVASILSGIGYAILGVTIRKNLTSRVPAASVLFLVATVGVATVGGYGIARLGWAGIAGIANRDYWAMAGAGICNTAAFICLAIALRETSVIYVNSLSAVQVALAGLLGVTLFGEVPSWSLALGVGLTMVGLFLMHSRTSERHAPSPVRTDAEPIRS
ncbi:MAG: DMT family transporter [Planctomycetes bacterium]|nr:DMT family transporter [Planctomycetota bacterium]